MQVDFKHRKATASVVEFASDQLRYNTDDASYCGRYQKPIEEQIESVRGALCCLLEVLADRGLMSSAEFAQVIRCYDAISFSPDPDGE